MENNCEPCEVNNKHKLSIKWCVICEESLCEECTENHRAMKMSRDHHLVDSTERAKHIGISSQGCEKHENMLFEYFCVNHDTLCCKECLAMTHRMCEKVVSIDMAAKGSKHSQPFLDSMELVKHVMDTTSNLRNHLKENFQSTENDEKRIRKGVQARIAALENSMMKDLERVKKQCIDTIDKKMNETENIEKQARDQIETYDLVGKYGTDTQAFILIHSSKKILTYIEDQTKALTESTTVNSLRFSESSSNSIGSVKLTETPCKIKFEPPKRLQPQIPVEKTDKLQSFKFDGDIDLQSDGKVSYNFKGITVHGDNILLCDSANSSVMVCSEKKYQYKICTKYTPRDIAVIPLTNNAVTSCDKDDFIQFINLERRIYTKQVSIKGCKMGGIDATNEYICLGLIKCISLLDHEGKIMKKIEVQSEGVPWYICFSDPDILYWTDGTSLNSIRTNMQKLFCYTSENLQSTWKVTIDNHGHVYVVGRNSNQIHRLRPNGTFIDSVVKDGIYYVPAICFSKDCRELFVSNNCGTSVSVFKAL